MYHLAPLPKLVLHLLVACLLAYLAFMILGDRRIPKFVGLFLAVLAGGVLAGHLYIYYQNTKH